jgi:hypothetical protein
MVLDAIFGSPVYIEHLAGDDDATEAPAIAVASGASDSE